MAEKEMQAWLSKLKLEASQLPDMTTVDIATTNGDVFLTLGQTRLRVSSVILSSASPVFKAMLGPDFLEGQGERSAQNPKEIPLPDDDVAVMTRLCRLLHHQGDCSSRDPKAVAASARGLFNLAVLADKYDCIGSIQMAGGYLLFDLESATSAGRAPVQAMLNLVAASYILEDGRHFALFTRRLVLDFANTFSTMSSEPALAVLPNVFLRKCFPCQLCPSSILTVNSASGGAAKSCVEVPSVRIAKTCATQVYKAWVR